VLVVERAGCGAPMVTTFLPHGELLGVAMSKFELYRDPQSGFRWRLRSTDGRTIAVSAEAHQTIAEVLQNIATVQREASVSDIDDQTATTF
jgi:uncharacterized protein YegP (UPF0339 family)